jgi:hypothetical protein
MGFAGSVMIVAFPTKRHGCMAGRRQKEECASGINPRDLRIDARRRLFVLCGQYRGCLHHTCGTVLVSHPGGLVGPA